MPGLDFYRQNYPEQFDGLNDYQALKEIARGSGKPIGEVAARLGMKEPGLLNELTKGIASGIDGMQAAGYGLGALGSEAVGATGMRDWFMKHAQANQREAQQNAAAVDDIRDIGSPTEFGYWAANNVGSMLPQLPLGMTGAGAGGALVARKAAASAVEKAIASGLSATAAREAGKQAAAKASTKMAEYLGGAAVGAGQETGDIFLDIHDKTGEYQPGNALLHGIAAGSVENLPETLLLQHLKAGRPKGMSRKAYVGKEFAQQAVLGGIAEEGAQDAIEQNALSVADPNYKYDPMRTVNAAAAGAVGAGTIGGGFAAITPSEKAYAAVRDPVTWAVEKIKTHKVGPSVAQAREEIAAAKTPEEALGKLFNTNRQPSITDPLSEEEHGMDDTTLDKSRQQVALREAQEIVSSPAGMYPNHVREAAAATIASQVNWPAFRDTLKQHNDDKKSEDEVNELLHAAGLEDRETRNSLMRPVLTDNFGEQEGRDMDADTVTDNFGNEVRTSPTVMFQVDESGVGSALRRTLALQKLHNNKATIEGAKKTVTLADALIRGGYWPKEVVDAAKSSTQKENLLTKASTLITWMQKGMPGIAQGDSVVEALVRQYGGKLPELMNRTYEEAVNSGLVERNDELFKERRVEAMEHIKRIADHGDVVLKNLGTEWKNKVIKHVGDKWIVDKTTLAGIVKEARRVASTGGDNVDNKVMEQLFPNKENRLEVMKHLYDPSISEATYKKESRSTKPAIDQEDDDKDSVDFMREADELLSGNAVEEDGGEQASEDFDSNQEVRYHSRAGGHAFRKRDKESREALKAKKAELGANQDVRVEEVGVVDAALDRERRIKGGELTGEERSMIIFHTLKRYAPKQITGRPVAPPENASDVSKRLYAEEKARWGKKLATVASQINRSHIVLKTTSLTNDAKTGALDYEAIRSMKLERKLDDPRNRPEEGTLWIETQKGGKLLVNASQILRAAFKLEATHQEVGFSGKNGDGDEIQINKATPQNTYDILMGAMGDISLIPEFTGNWGYVQAGGEAVQVTGDVTLPNNFTLVKANARRKNPITMQDVVKARKELSRNLSQLKDEVGGEFETGLLPSDLTTEDKLDALRVIAEKRIPNDPDEGATIDVLKAFLESFDTMRDAKYIDSHYGKSDLKQLNEIGAKLTSKFELEQHKERLAKLRSAKLWDMPKGERSRRNHYANLKKWFERFYPIDNERKVAALHKVVERGGVNSKRDQHVIAALRNFLERYEKFANNQDARASAGNAERAQLALNKWFERFHETLGDETIDRKELFTPGPTKTREKDGLAAYDPDKVIHRDAARGLVSSANIAMQAQTVVGTSKTVDPKDAKKFAPALQGFPTLTSTDSQKLAAEKLQTTVDWIAETMRNHGVDALLASIGKMDISQVKLTKAALFGRDATVLREHIVFDTVVGKDGKPHRVVDKDAGGYKTKGFTQPGPLQLSSSRVVKEYFGGDHQLAQLYADKILSTLKEREEYLGTRSGETNTEEGLRGLGQALEELSQESSRPARRDDTGSEEARVTEGELGASKQRRNTEAGRVALLEKLKAVKPVNEIHRRALKNLIAIVDGTKQGDLKKAQLDLVRWDGQLGEFSGVQQKVLDSLTKTDEAPVQTEVPEYIRDYDEEYGFNQEQAAEDELYAHQRSKAVDPGKLDPNTPVWSLYTSRDDGEAGKFVAAFKDMGAAQWLAERDGLTVVNELAKDVAAPSTAAAAPARAPATATPTSQLEAYVKAFGGKNKFWDSAAKQALESGNKYTIAKVINAAKKQFGELKSSEQKPKNDTQATPEQMKAVEAELHRILGDDIKIAFEDLGVKSGEWTKDATGATIRIAINSNVMGTGFHEAMHQLFSLLRQHGGQASIDTLQRVATSPLMQGRLRKLLKDHPEAMAQLKDAEEAVAYMFQFWMMDPSGFKLGPETKTVFQKIKSYIDKAMALISRTVRERLMNEERTERDQEMVDDLMSLMASGAMADKASRAAVVDALNKDASKHNAAMEHLGQGYSRIIQGVGKYFATAEGMLESYNIPALTKIARLMHQRAGEEMGGKAGFLEEVRFKSNHYEAKINKLLAEATPDDLEIARSWLVQHPDKAHPSEEINKIVQGVHRYLGEMRKYIQEKNIHRLEEGKWVPIDFRKHYFPQVWDSEAVSENIDQFVEDLVSTPKHKRHLEAISKEAGVPVEEVAQGILQRVLNPMAQPDLEETTSDIGMTPAATAINRRTLDWLDMTVFDKYMSKDMGKILHSYTHNIVKRGEYQSRFGFAGKKLAELVDEAYGEMLGGKELIAKAKRNLPYYIKEWALRGTEKARTDMTFTETPPTLRWAANHLYRAESENKDAVDEEIKATLKKLEPAVKSIMAMEGTLGNEIDPGMRKLQNWITTYQNFRVLAPGLFGSFMDIMGVVREGGEFKDAWGAFVAGIKEAKNIMQDKYDDSEIMQRAALFGSADAGSFSSAVGQHSQSVYMSGKAKEWSDKLFKYNGMEGWNRGVRAYATAVGERIILDWVNNGLNRKDKAEVARFERLYGKDFDPKDIKLDKDGRLDAADPRNIAAVNRWVHDAVIAPNAAHRPYWMSDPHFQIVSHLKSFSYSQHAVMLKQVAAQARLGNYRPALVSLLGYAPVAIAAGAIKELLIPGDEPAWMKGGLGDYLSYGWERAGILGIPQMYAQNLYDSDPAAAFGPTANQLQDLLTVPFGELQVGVPLTDMKIGWRDHRTFEEIAAAAPFGSVLRRGGKNIDDWIAK